MLPKMNLTPALLLDRERLSLRHSLSLSLSLSPTILEQLKAGYDLFYGLN
jgi:hypothetical protein